MGFIVYKNNNDSINMESTIGSVNDCSKIDYLLAKNVSGIICCLKTITLRIKKNRN